MAGRARRKRIMPPRIALEAANAYRPGSEDVLIDLAIAYFHAEQYEKALPPLSKATSQSPNQAGPHHMLGKTYFMLGNFAQATSSLSTRSN